MKKMPQKATNADANTVGVGINVADEANQLTAEAETRENTTKRRRIKRSALTPGLKSILKRLNDRDRISDTNHVIAIDKLKIRLEASIADATDGDEVRYMDNDVVLQLRRETGTEHHRNLWDVFFGGQLIGNLATGGRMDNMARYDYLTVNNDIIWQQGWSDGVVMPVIDGLRTKFNSVANLDICIDGLNDIIPIFDLYQWTNSVTYKQIRNSDSRIVLAAKGKPHFGANKFDDKVGHYQHYYIGAKGADKRFIVYEKNQEIKHISPHKQYIRDTWNINGMNVAEDDQVTRCELRLKGEQLDRFDITDLRVLEDAAVLTSIFKTACDNFVDFRITDGKVNINYAEKIDLADSFAWECSAWH